MLSGVKAPAYRIAAYVVAALVYGVGGVLAAGQIQTPDLTLGEPYLLTSVVAVVLGGAVLTETTFEWKGLGYQLAQYLTARDFVAVQGIVMLLAVIVAVTLERRRAKRIPLPPFLLAIGMGALQLGAAIDFMIVSLFPLSAAARENETADEQAEDEYQEDDDPLVGRESKHGSLPLFDCQGLNRLAP